MWVTIIIDGGLVMGLDVFLSFLFWNMCIHIFVLFYWIVMILFFKEFVFKIHEKLFSISESEFNRIHYCLIGYYKLTVIIFIIAPFIVLKFF